MFQENGTIRFRVTLEDEVPAGQQPNIVGVDAYVIVLDDNDNPPRFLNVPYEAVAEEDLPVGSTILSGIKVIDPDLLGDTIDLTCVPQPQVSHSYSFVTPLISTCIAAAFLFLSFHLAIRLLNIIRTRSSRIFRSFCNFYPDAFAFVPEIEF